MTAYSPQEIRQLRTALNMTPTQFAAACGVCENTARRWEIGDRRPRGAALILFKQLEERAEREQRDQQRKREKAQTAASV